MAHVIVHEMVLMDRKPIPHRERFVLLSLKTASAYDVCKELAAIASVGSESQAIEQFIANCMGSYRKKVRQPIHFALPMKSKRATQLYYQFRLAQTFKELVRAFETASVSYRYHILSDSGVEEPPSIEEDREDFCTVQEHYESILENIFSSTDIAKEVLDDLQQLYATLAVKRSANFMKLVAHCIAEGLDHKEAARNAFLVAKQISGPGLSITADNLKEIFGDQELTSSLTSIEPKKKKNEMITTEANPKEIDKEIESLEKSLNMTSEEIEEQRKIDDDPVSYRDGLKVLFQEVQDMVKAGSLVIHE